MAIMKTAKIPKGTKKALRKPSRFQSGPITIAKIANIMIIRKTGKIIRYQTYIKENCLRNKCYNVTKKHHQ